MKTTALKDAFTPNKIHLSDSPSHTTGYGRINSSTAKNFLTEGLSYIQSIVFSGNPSTVVEEISDEEDRQYWGERNFDESMYCASGGFGFGGFLRSLSVGASASGSTSHSKATTNSTWYADSNPMGRISAAINEPSRDYPALQIATGYVKIVEPQGNSSSNRPLRRSRDRRTENLILLDDKKTNQKLAKKVITFMETSKTIKPS